MANYTHLAIFLALALSIISIILSIVLMARGSKVMDAMATTTFSFHTHGPIARAVTNAKTHLMDLGTLEKGKTYTVHVNAVMRGEGNASVTASHPVITELFVGAKEAQHERVLGRPSLVYTKVHGLHGGSYSLRIHPKETMPVALYGITASSGGTVSSTVNVHLHSVEVVRT